MVAVPVCEAGTRARADDTSQFPNKRRCRRGSEYPGIPRIRQWDPNLRREHHTGVERFGHCPSYLTPRMTTQGEDILAWLNRAITRHEDAARAAVAFGDAFAAGDEAADCVYGTGPGGPYMRVAVPGFEGQTEAAVAHFALHGPESVLRRCAADRRTFERHTRYRTVRDMTWMAFGCKHAVRHESRCGYDKQCWPCADFIDLARGYGWTEGER